VVRDAASRAGIAKLAPHDLRRTCARLCHRAGGELDQIQFSSACTTVFHPVLACSVPNLFLELFPKNVGHMPNVIGHLYALNDSLGYRASSSRATTFGSCVGRLHT
jgi:hypothetical protein